MGCEKGDEVRALVSGRLSRKATLSALDHMRECEDCRSLMTEHARVHAAVGRGEDPPRSEASTCGAATAPAAKWLADDDSWRSDHRRPARRAGAKRIIILGIAISGLMFASGLMRSGADGPAELTWEELAVAAALESGRPALIEPSGAVATRPKALAAILPAGNRRFTLHVVRGGERVLSRVYDDRDEGATFDDVRVRAKNGELPATEALVPFPRAAELPLEPGARYLLNLELPNGNASASAELEVD